MPDILSYFTQKCGKSIVCEYLPIANSYKEYNPDKNITYNHMDKVMFQEASPRKLVVEIVSTDLVGTLQYFTHQMFPKSL